VREAPERFSRLRRLAVLALWGTLAPFCTATATEKDVAVDGEASGCALSDAELEAAGAVIGEIIIDARDIFDTQDPADDKALFRVMNNLHVRTRKPVIARQLLFDSGTPFRRQLLDESERILRNTNYLYDAQIFVVGCDHETVDLRVLTRDVWTLQPGISFSRSGGESRFGLDLWEENFLGRGGSVFYRRRVTEERTSSEIGYADQNLGGRWIALDTAVADNSDGHLFRLSLARPFYALDTRWALGGRFIDERRVDDVYSLGDDIGEFQVSLTHLDLYHGRSGGLNDGWVRRWLVGVVYDDREFANANDSLDPALIPQDRKLVYPYLEYQVLEDRFARVSNLDQIHRTEDVLLGADMRFRLGMVSEDLGSDRNGLVFSATGVRGYGDPDRMLWSFSAHTSGRVEGDGLTNALAGGSARWYLRQSERRLLFAALSGDVSEELDLDNPLELGGDNGLRGYPLRYQRGDSRMLFTLEQRYFTDYYLWRLFRVGHAIFFDIGRVWGENPYGGENLGWLRDLGFGLRFASTRSSSGRMLHLDLAFPLDGDSSIENVQLLFEARRTF
jgi:hypothetical protein